MPLLRQVDSECGVTDCWPSTCIGALAAPPCSARPDRRAESTAKPRGERGRRGAAREQERGPPPPPAREPRGGKGLAN